jgi:hypothetical protein
MSGAKYWNWKIYNRAQGFWEPWTGPFDTIEKARKWYVRHGEAMEKAGRVIALFKGAKRVDLDNPAHKGLPLTYKYDDFFAHYDQKAHDYGY